MDTSIEFIKSAQDNAQAYFEKSKRAKLKARGAGKSIEELRLKLSKVEAQKQEQKAIKVVEKREWFEKFNWFFTSEGELVIGGRSAEQNEELNSKHFEKDDLFFHADIFGASVVILKGGASAGYRSILEAAQFAASFSKAWENMQTTVDVYSMKREQVTKSTNTGSLGTGSFLLKGERQWHKSVPLELCAFADEIGSDGKKRPVVSIAPSDACRNRDIKDFIVISIGNVKKSDAAKLIAKRLHGDVDYIMQHLPAGPFRIH